MLANDEQSPPYQLPTDPVLATAIPSATSSHVLPWWGFTRFLRRSSWGSGTQWSTMIEIKSSLNFSNENQGTLVSTVHQIILIVAGSNSKYFLKQMSTLPAGLHHNDSREMSNSGNSRSFAPVTHTTYIPGIYYLLVAYYRATCYLNRNLP